MDKIILVVVFIFAGFTGTSVFASDQQFSQMEQKKVFDKIRTKMIVGCYTQGKQLQSPITSLEQLQTLFPQRVRACSCFQSALSRVSNRTIYEDSKHSYQLYLQKKDALKLKDKARLKAVEAQIRSFEPFMSKIIKQCGLNQ